MPPPTGRIGRPGPTGGLVPLEQLPPLPLQRLVHPAFPHERIPVARHGKRGTRVGPAGDGVRSRNFRGLERAPVDQLLAAAAKVSVRRGSASSRRGDVVAHDLDLAHVAAAQPRFVRQADELDATCGSKPIIFAATASMATWSPRPGYVLHVRDHAARARGRRRRRSRPSPRRFRGGSPSESPAGPPASRGCAVRPMPFSYSRPPKAFFMAPVIVVNTCVFIVGRWRMLTQ